MKVTIYTADGEWVSVDSLPDGDTAQLLDDWKTGAPTLTLTLEQPPAVTHINSRMVVRIDVEEEVT